MAKKTPFFAIAVCSVIMLSSNANAFWWDIIKGIASSAAGTAQAKLSAAPAPTAQDTLAALEEMQNACQKLPEQGFPCGMGCGTSFLKGLQAQGRARQQAADRADGELSKAMGQFVKYNAEDIYKNSEGEKDEESAEYKSNLKVFSEQTLKGAQTYLSYSHKMKDEKRKDGYEVCVVRVLDVKLFERAMGDVSQGKPIGKQIIDELAKGFISTAKSIFTKKK